MNSVASFGTAVADFQKFLLQQEYPSNLLWVTHDDIVFWRSRFFFCRDDSTERSNQARAKFEDAMSRNIGVMFEGICRTEQATVCRIYVPSDALDAEYRMIPKTGIKFSALVDPKPATPVDRRIRWWIVKGWGIV